MSGAFQPPPDYTRREVEAVAGARVDRVEMLGGVYHLPAEFREVARLANRAGLEGYEVAEIEVGLDLDLLRERVTRAEEDQWPSSTVRITYRKVKAE